jgi:hypothetical protein
MLKLMTFMDAPYTYRQTKKLIKVILYELNKSPGTLETLRSITIKYFAHNVFAEYSENDIIKNITYQEMFDQSNLVRNNVLTKYANKKGAIVLQMQNSPN